MSAQTDLQEVTIWKSLDKTQPKLRLVNQLPNQDKFDFEEKDLLLNVMNLHNATTGLVNRSYLADNLMILGLTDTKRAQDCQSHNQGTQKFAN